MARQKRRRCERPLEFDRLGDRCLPAAGLSASVAGGVLTIIGTESADVISVVLPGAPAMRRLGVKLASSSIVVEGVGSFRSRGIRSIQIAGGGGDDSIQILDNGRTVLPTSIDAGAGNDTVYGGSGADRILGGDGDDVLWGGKGRNRIDGGAGRDTIDGVLEPLPPPPPPPPGGIDLGVIEQQVVTLVNQERQAQGLAPLMVNAQLVSAARLHAGQMASFDVMQHTIPGAAFPSLIDRITHVGYRYRMAGENIAYGYSTAVSVMTAWMQSPGHRENIMRPEFREIGIAIATNSRGVMYWCQVFGQPA
jgi:Ca2+-binding RTX toxin-like protein